MADDEARETPAEQGVPSSASADDSQAPQQAAASTPAAGGDGGDGRSPRPADPEREARIAAAKAMAAKVAAARAAAQGGQPSAPAQPAAAAASASEPAAGGAPKRDRPADPEREAKIAAAKAMAAKVAAARGGGAAPAPPAAAGQPAEDPRAKMARVAAAAASKGTATPAAAPAQVTRRSVLRWLMWGSVLAMFGEAAGGSLAMFWPDHVTGFGGVVQAGTLDEFAQANGGPWQIGAAHAWMVHPDPGLLALWWRCPHLGCTIPWRKDEGIFHCPCHGSEFNYAGSYLAGPAPHSMWAFPIKVQDGKVWVDTGKPELRIRYEPSDVQKWGYPMKA